MPPHATSFENQAVADTTPSWCFGRESVVAAIEAMKRGEQIVVVDDETRENEGDLILAAEKATKESIAFMVLASYKFFKQWQTLGICFCTPILT